MRAPMGLLYIVIILVTYCLCECNFKVERGSMSMPNAQCSTLTLGYKRIYELDIIGLTLNIYNNRSLNLIIISICHKNTSQQPTNHERPFTKIIVI